MPKTFLITHRQETKDSVRFDLLVDDHLVLEQVIFMKAFHYVVEHTGAWDAYCHQKSNDSEDSMEMTGAELTQTHAERQAQIAMKPQEPCKRCDGPTTWIGYSDIAPYGPYPYQQTFFMQCQVCGFYRQIGFYNQDDWTGETYKELMQGRVPFVRVVRDPFVRSDTLRVTSRSELNPMGRLNLNGYEFHTRESICIYDQDAEEWRDGRVEYDPRNTTWFFTSYDGGPDIVLRQGMKARFPSRSQR
jgi:hypothetical protein